METSQGSLTGKRNFAQGRFPGSAGWWCFWAALTLTLAVLLYLTKVYETNPCSRQIEVVDSASFQSFRQRVLNKLKCQIVELQIVCRKTFDVIRYLNCCTKADLEAGRMQNEVQVPPNQAMTATIMNNTLPRTVQYEDHVEAETRTLSMTAYSEAGSSTRPIQVKQSTAPYNKHQHAVRTALPRFDAALMRLGRSSSESNESDPRVVARATAEANRTKQDEAPETISIRGFLDDSRVERQIYTTSSNAMDGKEVEKDREAYCTIS